MDNNIIYIPCILRPGLSDTNLIYTTNPDKSMETENIVVLIKNIRLTTPYIR